MKNVIYINCWVDPWVKVAQKLQEEQGYKPVWWIGYSEMDNSHNIIPSVFPEIIYQDNLAAWQGQFPKEIEEKAADYFLDIDFLRKHADQELQAIKMMDRVDPDRHSFNFMERQRHFRNMIKKWMVVLDLSKIDMVISTEIPHRLYDYVLFWLCKDQGIPYVMMNHTPFAGRYLMLTNDFYTIGNSFIDDWHKYEQSSDVVNLLPDDIKQYMDKVKKDYQEGAPQWMRDKSNTVFYESNARKIYQYTKRLLLGQRNLFYLFSNKPIKELDDFSFAKKKSMKYEESYYTPLQRSLQKYKRERYLKSLLDYYESQTTTPDANETYVCFFMHYQPEATTSPAGDIFVDQRLCVEVLLNSLPHNYKVYVKEHRHQFLANRPGQTSRMKDLYDDLLKNDRVRLISTTIDSFELMKNSKAVATVTGTVGWEAMVRKKPVIVFGLIWFENYSKGVLRITDEESAKDIYSFIENYKYDEHSLLAYLASFGKNTSRACFFREDNKKEIGQTVEESANIIVGSILGQLNKCSII